jgi:hypothetical protein
LWVTLLTHLPTGQIWHWRIGPGAGDERGDLRAMLGRLPTSSLIVADAGFVGYPLLRELVDRGQAFLVRVGNNVSLRSLRRVGVDERQALLWPDWAARSGEPALGLRLIELKAGRKRVFLATNVLDSRRLPRAMAGQLYRMRWGVELTYRHLKQTLERRKLYCRTPEHATLELSMNLLGLAVLTLVAMRVGLSAGCVSVSGALAAVRRAVEGVIWKVVWPGFVAAMRLAVLDRYQREGPKTVRKWPRQKTEPPPRPPKLRPLTAADLDALLVAGLRIYKTG